MFNLRSKQFETNSSSIHALIFARGCSCGNDYTDFIKDNKCYIKLDQFDRENQILKTPYQKASYLFSMLAESNIGFINKDNHYQLLCSLRGDEYTNIINLLNSNINNCFKDMRCIFKDGDIEIMLNYDFLYLLKSIKDILDKNDLIFEFQHNGKTPYVSSGIRSFLQLSQKYNVSLQEYLFDSKVKVIIFDEDDEKYNIILNDKLNYADDGYSIYNTYNVINTGRTEQVLNLFNIEIIDNIYEVYKFKFTHKQSKKEFIIKINAIEYNVNDVVELLADYNIEDDYGYALLNRDLISAKIFNLINNNKK